MVAELNSLAEIRNKIFSGETTCESIAEEYLKRIDSQKHLNAFLEVFSEETLAKAKFVDSKIKSGTAGKLAGLFVGIKDNICYKGHKVSAASKMLENFESLISSTAVDRLIAEDTIIIGRLNCDEFAMGASNENSAFGPVLNYADTTRVSGGSSGGPAVAVQAGLCHVSLGTDTGGSVRQPASFCGIWGLKPSYGTVSRYGVIAYASSFDQISPFAKSYEDLAMIMEVISGKDDKDATMAQNPPLDFSLQSEAEKKMSFAVYKEVIDNPGLDKDINEFFKNSIEKLKENGHKVELIDFPLLDTLVPCYYALTTAEASSNLSRYSGLTFGHRTEKGTDLESMFVKSRSEGFGTEVKRRIMLGNYILSSENVNSFYTKAQKVRRLIKNQTEQILSDFDFILLPTTATAAFKLGEKVSDPLVMYLADNLTVQANITGNPAISIPVGETSEKLPFGIQLIGAVQDDVRLVSASAAVFQLLK